MIDGCKEVNFMEIFIKFNIYWEICKEMGVIMPLSWENLMNFNFFQPSVTVAKDFLLLCNTDLWMQRRIIYVNGLTYEKQD